MRPSHRLRRQPPPLHRGGDGEPHLRPQVAKEGVQGQGRASDLLYTGRSMSADDGLNWGFYSALHGADSLLTEAQSLAASIAAGPAFAHAMTKNMLHQEWSMSVEQAIEAEAQAQAICMQTQDFERAYNAFVAKQRPVFEGD